ncbi:hypothetical protein [Rhizobium oryziradicis]|uniref:WWE domain-containing protein n=1 Tax=Rhizobium oryziradicis TaxID=1867956 RepID=A0A1Q8ZWP0_9HYPH|nr:hypothetical protein [Rhizobium oryziradicis]OLP46318.1 hypothetical protein BJF95_03835 [Rhizobium oryziradicis]
MLVALNQFLKENLLTTSAHSISVEELSDILLAEVDQYRLNQVKPTLSNSTLISAVREAYEIFNLADETLRERLVFQIVCRENQSNIAIGAVTADQAFTGKPHDSQVYTQTLKRFDLSNPVLVSAHLASAILLTLWNAGVEKPSAAIHVKTVWHWHSERSGTWSV